MLSFCGVSAQSANAILEYLPEVAVVDTRRQVHLLELLHSAMIRPLGWANVESLEGEQNYARCSKWLLKLVAAIIPGSSEAWQACGRMGTALPVMRIIVDADNCSNSIWFLVAAWHAAAQQVWVLI